MGWMLEAMSIEMPAVAGHPNRAGFRGVLTMVDVASDRAPAGARGHRVVLTRRAAEAAIPSLLGMALDYTPTFDRHDVRRKVGVITRAEIVGRGIEVGGFLYARDFPEIVEEIERSGGIPRVDLPLPTLSQSTRGGGVFEKRNGSQRPVSFAGCAERSAPSRPIESQEQQRRTGMPAPHQSVRATSAELGMSYEIADARIQDLKANVWVLNQVTFTGAAILRREKAAYRGTWIGLE
jgi:hypothetical protein